MRQYSRHKFTKLRRASHGFTIIELMIATLVFSTILLLLTFSVIAITQHYYKGIVQSETQNTSRTIMATLTQAVQFDTPSGSIPTPTTSGSDTWFCIGNQLFVYQLGYQFANNPDVTQDQAVDAFKLATVSACPNPKQIPAPSVTINASGSIVIANVTPAPTIGTETELLGLNMRLSQLTLSEIGTTAAVRITVKVTYGDNDLLISPSGNGPTAPDVICTGQTGFQFCAFSLLSTVVQPRLSS